MKRLGFTLFSLVALFFAPWWVLVFLACGGVLWFPHYYEVFALGFLFDILYGPQGASGFFGYGALAFLSAGGIMFFLEKFKSELRT